MIKINETNKKLPLEYTMHLFYDSKEDYYDKCCTNRLY